MENEEGKKVDLYIPRKCSATNRVIGAKDHASIQLNIGHIDANGTFTGNTSTFALAGYLRAKGEGDNAINNLATGVSLMRDISKFPGEHEFRSEPEQA
eukprot:CAMPEP_0205820504 /NCGR_PEP_ID=MMETSP0206-20130828/3152_1 /ASSEMBLY_ACC=CAM_ASM_000279 /TAXON_ID=36767 /ORGANISM="Euplotes focardii, Strain TN1" /LENGTH=97 /DNA_ID=CAMNT_0053115285 /DNA_START=49 /DNA_END=342 /DNA_ORIENTATION=+